MKQETLEEVVEKLLQMSNNRARKYTSPILEKLMSEITPEEMRATEEKMLQEEQTQLKEKNMKNKLLGFLDGLTMILLVWNTIYQFNQMNDDAAAGWLVASLYFGTKLMDKYESKK